MDARRQRQRQLHGFLLEGARRARRWQPPRTKASASRSSRPWAAIPPPSRSSISRRRASPARSGCRSIPSGRAATTRPPPAMHAHPSPGLAAAEIKASDRRPARGYRAGRAEFMLQEGTHGTLRRSLVMRSKSRSQESSDGRERMTPDGAPRAALPAWTAKQREIARKGGANVPHEKRSFAQNRELAVRSRPKRRAPRCAPGPQLFAEPRTGRRGRPQGRTDVAAARRADPQRPGQWRRYDRQPLPRKFRFLSAGKKEAAVRPSCPRRLTNRAGRCSRCGSVFPNSGRTRSCR